jgi:hypothetical protein
MDVAEHTYSSLEECKETLDLSSVEKLADTLFEIGKDLAAKNNYTLAVKWLERSFEWINSLEMGQLSRDAVELRLAISQALIQVYLDLNTPDSFEKANNHIAYIESEVGDKFVVLLFRTELQLRSPPETFDAHAYSNVIRRMMRVIDLSESTYRLLMNHIRQLGSRNMPAACLLMDEFLTGPILGSQHEEWIEHAIMNRLFMGLEDDPTKTIENSKKALDQIASQVDKSLSAHTAAGIHTVCPL